MGVINATPDSFSDGGRYQSARSAIDHGRRLLDEGADWLDVGGESTRPGAAAVGADEEIRRVAPVVEALAAHGARVSIDTRKEVVARVAVAAGASLINDVGASLGELAAELRVGWAVMHCQGEPATMQDDPRYGDVVAEVRACLLSRVEAARAAGVAELWIDPGIGFGKTEEHNLTLLAHLDAFVATGFPVMVGTSRKGFLGTLLSRSDGVEERVPTDDRLDGSLATATWAMTCGVAMVRVHDVRATVQAAQVVGGRFEAAA